MYIREFDEELPSDGEFNMNGYNCGYCDSESEPNSWNNNSKKGK
jgi:hypothetical protein